MRYYKLCYDFENDQNYMLCEIPKSFCINKFDVCSGEKVNKWSSDTKFYYDLKEGSIATDYLANRYQWLIFSSKVIDKTKYLVNENIQYLNVNIENIEDKTNLSGYKIANVITVLDALDLDNSNYSIFELDNEKILSIVKYALKKQVINKHHIFNLKNDILATFVSEEFKNIIEKNKLLGFKFLEVKVV